MARTVQKEKQSSTKKTEVVAEETTTTKPHQTAEELKAAEEALLDEIDAMIATGELVQAEFFQQKGGE